MTNKQERFLNFIKILSKKKLDLPKLLIKSQHQPISITFVNPLNFQIILNNPTYLDTLKIFDYVFADGMLLAYISSILRKEKIQRLSGDGNSFVKEILPLLIKKKSQTCIIGTTEDAMQKALRMFEDSGLSVSFCRNGYFKNDSERMKCIERINELNPEVIFIGMGAPQQDFMIEDIVKSGWKGLVFSCGGYLHQVADTDRTSYYPHLIDRLNLRWAFRIFKEPKKMIKRYFYDYIGFYSASLNLYFKSFFIKDIFK